MNILVCGPWSHFADDVRAHCATCHTPIVHRPHVDPTLVRLCERCAAAKIATDPEPPEVRVTDETVREVLLFNAKTKGTQ